MLKIASPEFIDIKLVTGHFNVLSFLHEMLPLRDVEAGVMTPWSFSCQHHVTDAGLFVNDVFDHFFFAILFIAVELVLLVSRCIRRQTVS